MKMRKKLFATVLLMACCTSLFAQKDPLAKAILDEMSNKYKAIPAFRADFSYSMEDPEADINDSFEGKVVVKGDMYKIMMAEQEISLDGANTWTYLKADAEVTVSEYEPEEEEISVSTIFDLYKEGFKYLLIGTIENGKVDVVDLVPENKEEPTFYKIRMEIMKGGELRSFKIFDKSGSRFTSKITSFTPDASIKDDFFMFDVKNNPDVEVIDLR